MSANGACPGTGSVTNRFSAHRRIGMFHVHREAMPLTFCPACRTPSTRFLSGLPCPDCRDGLLVAPPICARCLGLACDPDRCFRPWIRVEGNDGESRFDSVSAAFLSIGPGAAILKTWKRAPNPGLDHLLRGEVRAQVEKLDPRSRLVLVPVPQGAKRRWELAGGSVWRLCEMILAARGSRPEDQFLDTLTITPGKLLEPERSQQAKSKGDERYGRRSTIGPGGIDPKIKPGSLGESNGVAPTILLVDDFLTSGATLRSAVVATRRKFEESGWFAGRRTRIGVFVLGFRPTLFDR